MEHSISYGKLSIPLYRMHAHPLTGLKPIPESGFTGRTNTIFAVKVDVEVLGDNFLPAYTHGDNSNVVATDSMKNLVLSRALDYDGATLEGLLDYLGRQFLATYPQMQRLRLTGIELPFKAVPVPSDGGERLRDSDVLFSRTRGDYSTAVLECRASGSDYRVTGHRCGRNELQLIKVTGSSFTRFVRDEHTTLPERSDRPLFAYIDVSWTYLDPSDMLAADYHGYVAAEQVCDVVAVVFDQLVSESIQHLVHEMGSRVLERFPQLASISFDAQNRTWEPVAVSTLDNKVKVYTDPFPAYGHIHLTLSRMGAS